MNPDGGLISNVEKKFIRCCSGVGSGIKWIVFWYGRDEYVPNLNLVLYLYVHGGYMRSLLAPNEQMRNDLVSEMFGKITISYSRCEYNRR